MRGWGGGGCEVARLWRVEEMRLMDTSKAMIRSIANLGTGSDVVKMLSCGAAWLDMHTRLEALDVSQGCRSSCSWS